MKRQAIKEQATTKDKRIANSKINKRSAQLQQPF